MVTNVCRVASHVMRSIYITLSCHPLQKLLYSSSADTLVAWWTGFSDPESGIKSMKIRLLDGGDSCESHYISNMTTVVDLTEISANSSSYEFAHLKLKVIWVRC